VLAVRIAQDALSGYVYKPVGVATHYHTLAVRPLWSSSLQPVAVIGAHIFYRNLGFNGTPAAFTIAYMGRETQSGPARRAWPARPIAPVEEYAAGTLAPPIARIAPLPAPGWTPPLPSAARQSEDNLPESTIRPEFRNTGRPLI